MSSGHPSPDHAPRHAPRRGHFALVALDRPLPDPLTYAIPAGMLDSLRIGSLVEVPLRTQTARGVVVDLVDHTDFHGPLKAISQILTPEYHINPDLMALARWIADYYWCSPGEALAAVSFIGLNDVHAKTRTHLALAHADHWLAVSREVGPEGVKATKPHQRVIHALLASGNIPIGRAELCEDAGVGDGVLHTMIERGWLERVSEPVHREDDYPHERPHEGALPTFTPKQNDAFDAMSRAVHDRKHRSFLLHGVTGSGKTEVYMRVIAEALRMGRTAMMLVPEIALTPQTVGNFRARFGPQVGVYHSRLTLGQKFDLWRRIRDGEIHVMIGARSAVFSPLAHLGVVVVDEEHEGAFKQGETPRYHGRDVAVWRAAQAGAIAILGSATPSMETMHNAREGKYTLLDMPDRIGPNAPAAMTIIDLKRHLADGLLTAAPAVNHSVGHAPRLASLISPALRDALQKRLDAGEQSVLLLNRRGFANHVVCLKCEKSIECPHCDVPMTYHKYGDRNAEKKPKKKSAVTETPPENPSDGQEEMHFQAEPDAQTQRINERLVCHWCGHSEPLRKDCPKCGESQIEVLGLGTQRVEDLLTEMFPIARTVRIDVDTMKGKRSFIEAWQKITRHEVDIILGTQMIAKGFHLESVTLVGVISADFALFMPDFRSAERTFQLLTQVAGRAGRGAKAGEVLVQSFIPHHYSIEHAARLDEKGFYERELHIRKMLRFPPLFKLIGVLFSGKVAAAVREESTRLSNILKNLARRPAYADVKVLGPAPAPIGRIEDHYRWRILLRGTTPRELHELLRQGIRVYEEQKDGDKVTFSIDVDPVDLL